MNVDEVWLLRQIGLHNDHPVCIVHLYFPEHQSSASI